MLRILIRAVVTKEGIEATEAGLEEELQKFAESSMDSLSVRLKRLLGEENLRFFAEDVKTLKNIRFHVR